MKSVNCHLGFDIWVCLKLRDVRQETTAMNEITLESHYH